MGPWSTPWSIRENMQRKQRRENMHWTLSALKGTERPDIHDNNLSRPDPCSVEFWPRNSQIPIWILLWIFWWIFPPAFENPPRIPRKNSPGTLFEKIPLGFLQTPFLDTLCEKPQNATTRRTHWDDAYQDASQWTFTERTILDRKDHVCDLNSWLCPSQRQSSKTYPPCLCGALLSECAPETSENSHGYNFPAVLTLKQHVSCVCIFSSLSGVGSVIDKTKRRPKLGAHEKI